MGAKNLLLTISLLSSGRSKTIERCLSSLLPFKEQIEAEILVVDTDSKRRDNVHRILEQYADTIIPFVWCDDFSAARNISVDAAKGDWYLFLDDDEWFINPQPIIDFLKSGESAHYQWANFSLRNYSNDELTVYSDTWVTRMFRHNGRTRFVGRVHELITPVDGKPKNITALAGHTGYIFHNDEERYDHARRNLDLLLRLREEEPLEVRWVFQSLQEYNSIKEYDRELDAAREGYRLMDTAQGYKNACIRGVFAADIIRIKAYSKDWYGCIREYELLKRSGKSLGRVSKAYIASNLARATLEAGMTKKSLKHCERYLDEYNKLEGSPVEWTEDYLYFLADTFDDKRLSYTAAIAIFLELKDGKWDSFDKYFTQLQWKGNTAYAWRSFEKEILSAACKLNYDPRLAKMAGILWNMPETQKVLQEQLREMTDAGDENRFKLMQAILEGDIKGGKPLDLLIVWDDHIGKRENMSAYFRQIFSFANPLTLEPMLLRIGLRRGAVLDERISEIPLERWQSCVNECMSTMENNHIREMSGIIDDIYLGMGDERYTYFRTKADAKLLEAEAEEKKAVEDRQQKENQQEMQAIINQLQDKVEQLIELGMHDEAEKVLREIGKYSS